MDSKIKKELIEIIISLLIFFLYLAFFIISKQNSFCIIRHFVHLPCPTCGLTRSYISLLKFNFKDAFMYHPLFFLFPLLLLIVIFRNRKYTKILFHSRLFWIINAFIILIVYIIRLKFNLIP